MLYRWLYGLGVVGWGVVLVWLIENSARTGQPLLTVRASSLFVLLWMLIGLGFGLAWVLRMVRARRIDRAWVRQFQAMSASLDEAVILCDKRGKLRWHNAAAYTLVTQGGAKDALPALVKQQRQNPRQVLRQTVALSETERYTVQAVALDKRSFAVIYRPMTGGAAKNAFYENFIRRIVHDLRNPLAAIIGHAANLSQAPTVEPEAWRKSIRTIEDEAHRLTRLVDSMLFDARLAYVPLQPQRLDLADVLEEALYGQEDRAARQAQTLQLHLPPENAPFDGDRDLLLRTFENLIDNGLKYSPAGSTITVQLAHDTGDYVVTVQDNGEGIPPEYLPDRIFEPLVRAKQTGSGSGLGLSIVRKIVEMHGGSINAHSKLGTGTTMTVRFPQPQRG
ncbi:MAG: HAMP domain-containing histidine kinase [Anaerolineae bacterium]|nr:HAMP domain-containing histidine kinase [Anaerolineae bacterium]